MKSLKSCAVMLILFLALPMAVSAESTENSESTYASVAFIEGLLEMVDPPPQQNGMNFDFGSGHMIPIFATPYPSRDESYLFIVDDARSIPSGWNVTVSMSSFEEKDEGEGTPLGEVTSFKASITLKDPVNNPETGITMTDPLTIFSDDTPIPVISATAGAKRGHFETQWAGEDVELFIADGEIKNIMPCSYEATLTWSLSNGP